ncbi:hypothetical protein VTJ83DRAFT_7421 [Remersonia thermophila]|uniref:Uncharacterized protein n=1 Tax=Remersonia thermophila TaxID=72144 RepID=A0ABR4D3I2_9PEZI
MIKSGLRYMWLLVALLAMRASAACTSYGVDFVTGGTYSIDVTSNEYFTFTTVFQGCTWEAIRPILVGPDDNLYACSEITTEPNGVQVKSTCGIPYSAMRSGRWRIVFSGNQISTQRTLNLVVGQPQTTWVTVTPTVVVGVTTTARAQTVLSTVLITQTIIAAPRTTTIPCAGATRTITTYLPGSTSTITSIAVRTVTTGTITTYWTTTVTATASCYLPGVNLGTARAPAAAAAAVTPAASVAAVTSTVTATYTITSTLTTTVPGTTTTELVLRTTTATSTPPPLTVCTGAGRDTTLTVTSRNGTPATVTDIIYLTSHLPATVWVGQTTYTTSTNSASATACWRSGGWYG